MFKFFKRFFSKPLPQFQVVIQIPTGHCIFRAATNQKDVDGWVEAFDDSPAVSLKVYQLDPRGAYELTLEKGSEIKNQTRPIGFCR